MRGKLIIIEGTDCSGKETQTNALVDYMNKTGRKVKRFSFPMYDTPTGKIIGGPYLGKENISEGWFPELAPNVNPKVSSLYFAADRLYNIEKITKELDNGVNVVLDRYTFSNMAHQGGKMQDKVLRNEMYDWLYDLEFTKLKLPVPDILIFIHMPYEAAKILKSRRAEPGDQNENDENHLRAAETAYIEIADKFNFKYIECLKNKENEIVTENSIRSIDDISKEICQYVTDNI